MPRVRAVAWRLARAGEVTITQKGEAVDIDQAQGPVRIRAPLTSYTDVYRGVDFREHPERYRIGKGSRAS